MNKTVELKKAGWSRVDWTKLRDAILYSTPENKYIWEAPGPFDLYFSTAEAYAALTEDRKKKKRERRWQG